MKRPSSSQPRKQRKFLANAPNHLKKKFVNLYISKVLRASKKLNKRTVTAHAGMKIKIIKGKFKGKEGSISRVSVVETRIFVEGISHRNLRGREKMIPFAPANVVVIDEKIADYLRNWRTIPKDQKPKPVPKKKKEEAKETKDEQDESATAAKPGQEDKEDKKEEKKPEAPQEENKSEVQG